MRKKQYSRANHLPQIRQVVSAEPIFATWHSNFRKDKYIEGKELIVVVHACNLRTPEADSDQLVLHSKTPPQTKQKSVKLHLEEESEMTENLSCPQRGDSPVYRVDYLA
jgi:hypothetical protein